MKKVISIIICMFVLFASSACAAEKPEPKTGAIDIIICAIQHIHKTIDLTAELSAHKETLKYAIGEKKSLLLQQKEDDTAEIRLQIKKTNNEIRTIKQRINESKEALNEHSKNNG